jgi:ribose 1,5-bisphosphokinase
MGASGVGKDSLIDYARRRLAGNRQVFFAHRYITRPADAGGENHVALTPEEFAARQTQGCFVLAWQAHGLQYGIGREINFWLGMDIHVAINGSREHYPQARALYPDLVGVLIEAPPEVLAARLARRDREQEDAIAHRLERARLLVGGSDDLVRISNDGPLELAGERLVALLTLSPAKPVTPPSSGCNTFSTDWQ